MFKDKFIWIILSVLMFSACIYENYENVDDYLIIPANNNVNIKFSYIYNGIDLFRDKIHKVDLFVFDEKGQLVSNQQVGSLALSAFSGTSLYLQPGNYRIVCWGNVSNRSAYAPFDFNSSFDNILLKNTPLITRLDQTLQSKNGDPLYYAPNNSVDKFSDIPILTIPQESIINDTIVFYSAHAKINIYVKGIEDRNASMQNLPPLIEINEVPQEYNFEMHTTTNVISYLDQSAFETKSGDEIAVKSFYLPRLKNQNPIQIIIRKSSDNSVVTTLSLEKFIRDNNIDLETPEQQEVSILFEYKQTSVIVTLPSWQQGGVKPAI